MTFRPRSGRGLGSALRSWRRRRVLLVPVVAAAVLGVVASPAFASGPTISGAGSTWVQIALDQWRADATRLGLTINYQGVGSTAGRQLYIINQVDFAASEIPFLPSEVAQLRGEGKSYQYLPDVAGGTALMYNLKDAAGHPIRTLRLSAPVIADIFTGRITNWDDPALRADNPGLALPNLPMRVVIRSDGSGTSAKLADYIAHLAPSIWAPFARAHGVTLPVQYWPSFKNAVAVRGSDGVANFVSNPSVGVGTIGYVEAGYVYEHNFTPVFIKNRAGYYAGPSSFNVATALQHATLNKDFTQNLLPVYNAPERNAYPLASYSYLITQTTGFDPAKGAVLGQWIIYIACAGQREAAPLGYSPLPKNLIADVFQAVNRIPGAPTPPPITPSACPNPTVTGQGFGGGPQNKGSVLPPGPLGSGGGGGTGSGSGSGSGSGTGTGTGTGTGGTTVTTGTGTTVTTTGTGGTTIPISTGTGTDPAAVGVTVTPLTQAELAATYSTAVKAADAAHPSSSFPLAAIAIAVLLLAVIPLSLMPRRGGPAAVSGAGAGTATAPDPGATTEADVRATAERFQ
ncbi:MAG TPA: phosphate ABC transporter substrate-binding protein PstS [Actinomycetota bacterium]|nr:phosphate ABC transporter substrate-binding protein PstS [Actinomycetota bacterium]